ncbi:hypothetical protein FQN49_004180, partial [Arthroderma sp. PD_2]
MGHNNHTPEWIGDLFKNEKVTCPDGSRWKFDEKISEKSFVFDGYDDEIIGESQVVYHCHQVKGPSVGMEAIVKIRMQVPAKYPASPDPWVRAREALVDKVAAPTAQEIETLKYLTEKSCTVAPHLIHYINSSQLTYMPIPNGYLVLLIME